MRILFAADTPPDPNSGAAGTEFQTIEALRKLGHEVDCVWGDQLPHRIRHGNLHYLLELPRAYRAAIRHRAGRGYDVYHVNQPHCWLAAKDHQRTRRPGVFVQRSHGWELRSNEIIDQWRRRWKEPEKRFPGSLLTAALRKLLDRNCHRAVCYCEGTIVSSSLCKEYLEARHRAAPERVACIPQAPPLSFAQAPARPASPERAMRVLYVAQFAYFKAPRVVAEAIALLAGRFPRYEFTWVCDAGHHDAVRALLGAAAPRCRLLTWMGQEALREIYDQHGVFLFPSLFEGFGKAFLEAMARGLCVAATKEGGMIDVIRHGDNGLLVPTGDAAALADAAASVMSDPARFARMSQAARETAVQYTWERVARETVAFYERLLALKHEGVPSR
jgi:glycosyltransferase involved in cell wall biosynthesis